MSLLNIKSKDHDYTALASLKNRIIELGAIFFDLKVIDCPYIFTRNISHFTVLKSPHVHKKSREQFSLYTYKSMISMKLPSTTDPIKVREFISYLKSSNIGSSITITLVEKEFGPEIKEI